MMTSNARSMMAWTSSGSRRSDIAVNPDTSVNITVTCLRSPSTVVLDVRIFSTRCWGVYASGEANRSAGSRSGAVVERVDGGWPAAAAADGAGISLAPHSPQNLLVGGFGALQEGHVRARRAPHSPQ